MGRKSSLTTLPSEVQAAIIKARGAGATIDEIVAKLDELGHPRSRSAVGRYAQHFDEVAERQKDIRVVAEAFAGEFGGAENAEGKLMVQLLSSIGARMILPMATGDVPDIDTSEFALLARGTKDLMQAAKIDAERDAKIREETKKKAAEVAETAARKSGASAESINLVKAAILGLST